MYRLLTSSAFVIGLATSSLATGATTTEAQLVSRAEGGDVDAMLKLGLLHYLSVGQDGETGETVKWYRRAAEAGNVDAMMQLSRLYAFEFKNQPDANVEAERWNKLAISTLSVRADRGDLTAETHLAYVYDLNSNPDKAISRYRHAATEGSVEAMFELGAHYQMGWDLRQDDKEAVFWLTKAAENNHAKAMLYLSDAYEKGAGVEQDAGKAQAWRDKAAATERAKPKSESNEPKTYSWPED